MDNLVKGIKNMLSPDNLINIMKDANVIDDKRIKEEDVRKTLQKIDTNNLINIDELAAKLNDISEQSKANADAKKDDSDKGRSVFSIPSKSPDLKESNAKGSYDYIKDNVTGFLD